MALTVDALDRDTGYWYREEALVSGSPDEMSNRLHATAKYIRLSVGHRNIWTIEGRLKGLLPRYVEISASILPKTDGAVVTVSGRTAKMMDATNSDYVRQVVHAFLLNVQKDARDSRRTYTLWRYGLPCVVALFYAATIGVWEALAEPGDRLWGLWVVHSLAFFLALVADLARRRAYGVASRADRLVTLVLVSVWVCGLLAFALIRAL